LRGPAEPGYRGELTIRYVCDAQNEAEFSARVREWARDVWAAYASQQRIARNWVRRATGT